MSIICLDIGTKRIGVAKSDELGLAAHPLTVIERKNLEHDLARVIELCQEHETDRIVVGLPLDEEGNVGASAEKVLRFVRVLKQSIVALGLEIPVETWDERYSTASAEEMLIDADVSRAKRRRVVDKLAAAKILQDYMENKNEDSP
jgi:putative Holliday junction resolvase